MSLIACSDKRADEKILATVGAKSITEKEFLWRSELVVRPGNFKNKNIALNNLISEKILAIRAESAGVVLSKGELSRIKGIKEQAMRDNLFKEVAFKKVKADSAKINEIFKWAAREYEVEFYQLRDNDLIYKIDSALAIDPGIVNDLFADLEALTGKKPIHNISFKDNEDYNLQMELFSKPRNLGDVIGPLRIRNGSSLIMRITDWKEQIRFGGESDRVEWNRIRDQVHLSESLKQWEIYQFEMMQGKKIEFNKNSFEALATISYNYYIAEQFDSLKNNLSEIPTSQEIDLQAPFFTIDAEEWTIGDFKERLLSHPLVFRSKNLHKGNYLQYFRMAIIDMVTNHYLTKEAYRRDLDKLPEIKLLETMWTEAEMARNFRKQVMTQAVESGEIKSGDDYQSYSYWQEYIQKSQQDYGHLVQVNNEDFEKIKLTNIDYVAVKAGVPFPVSIPNFPVLISSGNMEYIKKVN